MVWRRFLDELLKLENRRLIDIVTSREAVEVSESEDGQKDGQTQKSQSQRLEVPELITSGLAVILQNFTIDGERKVDEEILPTMDGRRPG